jgi:hypothetical protein
MSWKWPRQEKRNHRNYPFPSVACGGTSDGTTTEPWGTSSGRRFRSVPVRFRCWFRCISLRRESSSAGSATHQAAALRKRPVLGRLDWVGLSRSRFVYRGHFDFQVRASPAKSGVFRGINLGPRIGSLLAVLPGLGRLMDGQKGWTLWSRNEKRKFIVFSKLVAQQTTLTWTRRRPPSLANCWRSLKNRKASRWGTLAR